MKKQNVANLIVVLLFFASALSVIAISFFTSSMMSRTNLMLEENVQGRIVAAAKTAATVVSAEELDEFIEPEDMQKPLYDEIHTRLQDFAENYNVMFVYYLRPYGDGQLQFVVDNDPDPETQVSLHDIVDMEPAPQQALGGQAATVGFGDYSIDWEGLLSAYAPLYDENGQVYCIAGVDISDEVILNTQRQTRTLVTVQTITIITTLASGLLAFLLYWRKARQSEAASLAKSQFLSRMSHEIRTPMNAIIGLGRMARGSENVAQIHHYLDNIGTASNHLLGLINDVLDISKIESGKTQYELLLVDRQAELAGVMDIIRPQAAAKNQTLNVAIDEAVSRYLFIDQVHINQVLVNLLSNAVKFTPEGGTIDFTVDLLEHTADRCHLRWTVKDNGIGIEQKYLDRLFDPFEQGDGGTTRKYGGTGLGLSIAKQLVEAMGGTIEVESAPGAGSTFSFSLWLYTGTEADYTAGDTLELAPGKPDLTGRKVLLVEDSDINQLIAEDIITGMGGTVETAADGRQAIERFTGEAGGFDLIFMDIQMPVMDGYQATRAIRSSGLPNAHTVPIIAMTANVFKEDIDRALEAGMNAHVGKPFELAQIEAAVARVLGGAPPKTP